MWDAFGLFPCNKPRAFKRHNHQSTIFHRARSFIRMKRTLGSLIMLTAVAMAVAQTSFTIVRPQDGSKVRETIRLLFPMNSIPDNGYVGIYIGGKFVEAMVPIKGAQYRYYDIDTKARQIPDGPLSIEAILYQDFADRPRIIEKTSVQVEVANSANISIPDKGLTLRYKFRPGTQWIYRLTQRFARNNLSEAMAGNTNTSSLLAGSEAEHVRLLYAIDNAYAGGDGLVRIQALPDKGKREFIITSPSSDTPTRYMDYQIAPVYMRLKGTGREVFGSIPRYFPLEGTTGDGYKLDLFAAFPLPTLPDKPVRLGAAWGGGFQLPDLADVNNMDAFYGVNSVVTRVPARAEFVGVEWQNGRPCARLRYSLAVGEPRTGGRSSLVNAQSINEDIWFALDLGTIIKMVRNYTIDQKIQGGTGTNTGTGVAGAGTGSRGGRNNGPDNSSRAAEWQVKNPPGWFQQGNNRGGGGQGGRRGDEEGGGPPAGSGGGRPGVGGQGGAPAGGRSGGGGTTTRIVRISVQQVFELEK